MILRSIEGAASESAAIGPRGALRTTSLQTRALSTHVSRPQGIHSNWEKVHKPAGSHAMAPEWHQASLEWRRYDTARPFRKGGGPLRQPRELPETFDFSRCLQILPDFSRFLKICLDLPRGAQASRAHKISMIFFQTRPDRSRFLKIPLDSARSPASKFFRIPPGSSRFFNIPVDYSRILRLLSVHCALRPEACRR